MPTPKLTDPKNKFAQSKRRGTVVPTEQQKQWSSGAHIHRTGATNNLFERPPHRGEGLEPYTGRADANSHEACGTVVNGKPQPYAKPGLMCVGPESVAAQAGSARRLA